MKVVKSNCLLIAFSAAALLVGCGGGGDSDMPELGTVNGTVTLNGQPVEGATIEFVPEKGRPSVGETDSSGKYVLSYKQGVDGAVIGKHSVSIRTYRAGASSEGDGPSVEGRPETIPEAYNDKTTLSVDVAAGDNTHDFALEGERKSKEIVR